MNINPPDDSHDHPFRKYITPKPGRTLIVGSLVVHGRKDVRGSFPDAIGIDMRDGPGVDFVHDLEEPLPESIGPFAHVVCASVLEHVRRPWLMAENIELCLIPGGTLYVSAPTVWRWHGYPDDYWRFTHSGIKALFPNIKWAKLMYIDRQAVLHPPEQIPRIKWEGVFPRSQILGFGYRE